MQMGFGSRVREFDLIPGSPASASAPEAATIITDANP
jgi:hypothetical protein